VLTEAALTYDGFRITKRNIEIAKTTKHTRSFILLPPIGYWGKNNLKLSSYQNGICRNGEMKGLFECS
jgi:hypothetical protein